MAYQPTTRLHISGYRFMRRRIECALLGRDLRAVNEPIRAPAQSLMAGLALAVILLAGCVVLALLRPQPGLATAPILMDARRCGGERAVAKMMLGRDRLGDRRVLHEGLLP